MKKVLFLFVLLPTFIFAQQLAPLTVKKIMRDPKWMGTSPSSVFWSPNGQKIYFDWNPDKNTADSLYFITLKNHTPQKVDYKETLWAKAERDGSLNNSHTKLVFTKSNTLYILAIKNNKKTALFSTVAPLSHPVFVNENIISFRYQMNLFTANITTGMVQQITNFKKGKKETTKKMDGQAAFLKTDALENSIILTQRDERKEKRKTFQETNQPNSLPKPIYIGQQSISQLSLSPNGKVVIYQLMTDPSELTNVPNYITTSGKVEMIKSRPNVGTPQPQFKNYIYNIAKDTVLPLIVKDIPGIRDIPKFIKTDYKKEYAAMKAENKMRSIYVSSPIWNEAGTAAFVVIRAKDHKDRWIMQLNTQTGGLSLIDRQHDDAWIGGPGIGYPYELGNVGWINNQTVWYQSEKTGYSHLYTSNIKTGKQNALTKGNWEVLGAQLSPDKKTFYITTNQPEPSQRQFYQLDIQSKKITQISQKIGGYDVSISPDGKYLAELFSTSVHPWELFLQQNKKGAEEERITHKAESKAYASYNWRKPKIITFKDRDNEDVYASIYSPKEHKKAGPAVIFVHGAGYLQDVQKFWSYYFREHMFMNMLVDQGYTVMDIDYRGSAGYGRNWRTAIYRFMGDNDLNDIVSGAEYMISNKNIDPNRIGIFGGSYGGFMTLMAMFRTNVFTCGAALRSVTDWAHYNHDYTSDILNLPQNDSIAYLQSSPIYYANGLQGHLLMCHGIVDINVHYQDIVRLTQRLIELGKENWQLASYPMESHGFKEPSSWTDEYTRVYKLFSRWLK